jgi:serralysin
LVGDAEANVLTGNAGNDFLAGGGGSDTLTGGRGKDRLAGGDNDDRFDFNSLKDSGKGPSRDAILDFHHGQGDKIDLLGIDANVHKSGNQHFAFIGSHAFSHHESQLRFAGHVVQGDVNGDGRADFEIHVNVSILRAMDFVL